MALGSSAYPDYCKAGKDIDQAFARLGAKALVKIQLGNELDGQLQSVREWQVSRLKVGKATSCTVTTYPLRAPLNRYEAPAAEHWPEKVWCNVTTGFFFYPSEESLFSER